MPSLTDKIEILINEQIERQTLHRDDRKGILKFAMKQLAQMWEDGFEVEVIQEFKNLLYGDM